jgi:hypothetical protein
MPDRAEQDGGVFHWRGSVIVWDQGDEGNLYHGAAALGDIFAHDHGGR